MDDNVEAQEMRWDRIRSIRRTLLALAVREARAYGTTTREVLASFAANNVRPELRKDLDTQLAALGVPASAAIEQAEQVFTVGDIDTDDLLLLVQGYAGEMPTPQQAREVSEVAARLFKAARRHAKRVGQAQVIADNLLEQDRMLNPPPEQPVRTFHRAQARTVAMPGRGLR